MAERTGRNYFSATDRAPLATGFISETTIGDMMPPKLTDFDQPLVFAFAITFTVIGMMAILGWFFARIGWTGPLGLVKGGVQ